MIGMCSYLYYTFLLRDMTLFVSCVIIKLKIIQVGCEMISALSVSKNAGWSYMFCLERQRKYEQTLYDIIHADVGRWKDLDRFWR